MIDEIRVHVNNLGIQRAEINGVDVVYYLPDNFNAGIGRYFLLNKFSDTAAIRGILMEDNGRGPAHLIMQYIFSKLEILLALEIVIHMGHEVALVAFVIIPNQLNCPDRRCPCLNGGDLIFSQSRQPSQRNIVNRT